MATEMLISRRVKTLNGAGVTQIGETFYSVPLAVADHIEWLRARVAGLESADANANVLIERLRDQIAGLEAQRQHHGATEMEIR